MATVVIFLERRYGLMTAYEELVTCMSNIQLPDQMRSVGESICQGFIDAIRYGAPVDQLSNLEIEYIEADMNLIPQENRENRRGKTKHKSWNDTRYQRKRKNDKSYF
jgi:hypothetical protein